MKPAEAIKRFEIMVAMRKNRGYHSEVGALKLGIKALKEKQAKEKGGTP